MMKAFEMKNIDMAKTVEYSNEILNDTCEIHNKIKEMKQKMCEAAQGSCPTIASIEPKDVEVIFLIYLLKYMLLKILVISELTRIKIKNRQPLLEFFVLISKISIVKKLIFIK